jgi:hypothetical protein
MGRVEMFFDAQPERRAGWEVGGGFVVLEVVVVGREEVVVRGELCAVPVLEGVLDLLVCCVVLLGLEGGGCEN